MDPLPKSDRLPPARIPRVLLPLALVAWGVLLGRTARAETPFSAESEALGRSGGAFPEQSGALWVNPALVAAPPRYSLEAFYQTAGTRPAKAWGVSIVDSRTSVVGAAVGYAERDWGTVAPGTPASSLALDPRACTAGGCPPQTDRYLQLSIAGGGGPVSVGMSGRQVLLAGRTLWSSDTGLLWNAGKLLSFGLALLDSAHASDPTLVRTALGSVLLDFYRSFRLSFEAVRRLEPTEGPPAGHVGGGIQTILFDQIGLQGGYRSELGGGGSVWSAGVAWYAPRFTLAWTYEGSNDRPVDAAQTLSFSLRLM